jgi:anti-anti-sigma factor
MSDQELLSIAITTADDEVVLALGGELDPHTAGSLADAIAALDPPADRVVLDLSALTFVDSAGLRVLLAANQDLTGQGRAFVLRSPTDTARRILEITGLLDVLTVE